MSTENFKNSLGEFSVIYPQQKTKSIKNRLEEKYKYTAQEIEVVFEQHNWNLEDIEDEVIKMDNNIAA